MKRRSKDQQGKEMQVGRDSLESLVDAVQVLIVVLDTEGHIVLFNRACQETTGYGGEEVLGRNWFDLFPFERVREGAGEFFQKLLDGQLPSHYEYPILTKEGQERLIEWDHTFLCDEEGTVHHVMMGMGRDLTERKRAEEALKRRLEQSASLSQASQAVTASLEPDQVLAKIVSLAREVVASDYASVVLIDEEGRPGLSAEDLPGVPAIEYRVRAEGFTDWIVRSRQAIVVDDIDEDGTVNPKSPNRAQSADGSTGSPQRPDEGPCTANPLLVEAGVKSFAGLPLVAKDRLLGVLYLHSLRPGNFRNQLPLLTTFANQAAIAIENARFYQAERKRAAQLAVVSQVARQTASILDPDQLLQEIVTAIQQSFNYYHVGLFLLDEAAGELEMLAIAGGFAEVAARDYRQAVGVGMIGWTAKTGQPLLANDVSQEPHYIAGFLEEGLTGSELCLPLHLAGQVIGVLDVQDTRLNAFDETDLLALETLADQIAVAIGNARLFRETKRRFEETMALYQTSLDITAQLEMPELLKSIVERAVVLLRAKSGAIYLYEPEREELKLVITYGYTEKYVGVTLKPGEGMAGRVLQTGEPLIVDDYRTWEGRAAVYEADQPFTAVLEVPLKWRDRIIGVLSINAGAQERTFNQDDVWLATLFANQAAVTIENARIYEEERKRVTQLELISGITQKIASILDLDELLSQVAHLIGDTFGYYYTSIFLVEADSSDELVLRAAAGPFVEALVDRLRLKIGQEGIAGWVAYNGEPLLVNDVSREPRYYSTEESKDTRSELAAPIKLTGEIIGVLDVQSVEPDAFSQDDVSILQTLADQLAVAIENARLFQAEWKRATQLAVVNRVAQRAASILDLDQLLQEVVAAIQQGFNYYNVTIDLLDEAAGELEVRAMAGSFADMIPPGYRQAVGVGMVGWTAETGQSLLANDVSQEPRYIPGFLEEPLTKSELCVPLKLAGKVIGVLDVEDTQLNAFDETDLLALETLADQIALAIENVRLYEETQRQSERLAQTLTLSEVLHGGLELEQVLERIAQGAVELGFRRVVINVCQPGEELVRVGAVTGIEGSEREKLMSATYRWSDFQVLMQERFRVSRSYLIRHGEFDWDRDFQGVVITSIQEDRGPSYWRTDEALFVPMWGTDGQPVGLLSVDEPADGLLPDLNTIQTLEAFANQAAIAIENVWLYEAEAQRRREADTLRQAAMALTSTLDLEETLDRILEQLHRVVAYDSASVQLLRDDHLEIVGGRGFADPSAVIGLRFPIPGDNPNTRVIERDKPVILADAQAAYPSFREPPHDHVRSWMGVPMCFRERTIGVITLDSTELGHFTAEHTRLATAFANQAAIAIDNARLFEETRKRMEQTQLLLRVSEATASALESTEVMRRIAREAAQALDADMTGAYLLNEEGKYLRPVAGYRVPPERLKTYREFRIPAEGHPFVEEAWRSQRTIFTNDAASDPRLDKETYRLFCAQSVLLMPMIVKDAVIGGLWAVWWEEAHHFTEEERRLLEGIVRQAAIALENARLYEQITGLAADLEVRVQERTGELARKAQELTFLYQASVALSSSLEVEEVLEGLARQAALVVGAVDCTICELQDDALVVVASYRNPTLPWRDPQIGRRYLLADYPATREAIEKGQPLRVKVNDPLADEVERAKLQERGHTALLQVHIVSRDQVVEVVEVFDSKPEREFSESDAALLQTIANQAGMAIEKVHLFQQVREERNHLELLYEVSRKLSASLNLEQTMHDIFQVSVAATAANRGSIFVFNDEGRVSYRILMRDLTPAEADEAIDRVLRKGLAGWVLEHKQPTIVFDTSRDERWLPLSDDPEPAGSAMTIPFVEHDRVRGLLTLVHPQPYHFSQTHLELFSSIAHQVAVVIERARLYEETHRRAQEVAQRKEQTDAIMQSMADGLIVTDLENRLVLANPAAEELLKFRLEDAIGQDIGANIRDDRLRRIVRDTLDKQQAGYEVDIELTDPYNGAHQRIMRAHTAVVNGPSGQPMGIVTTLRDVTHEREVQRLKDELISTVSHELRTPMTSVLGFSELLLSRPLSEEKRQLYIQTIHKEAQRLSALINDFLDIQRMERGQQEYHFEDVDLGELAREVVATYGGQSDDHTLTLDLPPDLPPVQADPDRLRQVFGNLLSNAIKFSPGGGVVAVAVQAEGDEIHVAVSDEGIGIPAEALPQIFERFFRVDSSDRRAIQGTGLGLAICKQIIEAHRGYIWAESQTGRGTTVTFSLPMMARNRILVIDDERDIREMFQRLLSEWSYEVLTAANGQEGLSLMEQELPDLVILDIAMPVMNGYQFLEKVKEDRRMKHIPVITISGVDTDIDRLKELGTDEFLSKPFSSTVLLETIQRLLGS